MLEAAVKELVEGTKAGAYTVYTRNVLEGRFAQEVNLDVYAKSVEGESRLLYVKVFYGRGSYRPWVEFFSITVQSDYFDTPMEDALIKLFSQHLGPCEKIHVEYVGDRETRSQLERRCPPAATRLGYKLFRLGFTWFKDWYFAEGFKEGAQKLQGEKPINEEARRRQIAEIREELSSFICRQKPEDETMRKALRRAEKIIKEL